MLLDTVPHGAERIAPAAALHAAVFDKEADVLAGKVGDLRGGAVVAGTALHHLTVHIAHEGMELLLGKLELVRHCEHRFQ